MLAWGLVGGLMIAVGACLWRLRTLRREALRLRDEIERFVSREVQSPAFSVRDDDFALFENAVVDLMARLRLSEANAVEESEKNRAFVQDVSHQFKTPIAGLRLYCELDESDHREQKLQLVERMEMLISALLTLEKLRGDGYAFEYRERDLGAITMDVSAQFVPMYPDKHISIEGGASIRCDGRWIFEALSNLIKNACEHTAPDGHVMVVISSSDSEAMIRVEDDGGGVPDEVLPRLFERFYRGGALENGRNVGLGLAITKTIVTRHHGSINAKNGLEGLCITVYLPVLHGILKES